MKRIIIALLVVFALGVTGCSVSTGSDGYNADPGVRLPDGDPTNPFEVQPPSDEDEDEVPLPPEDEDDPADEGDDPAQPGDEDETVFQMQTDADDVLTEAVQNTYYEQTFRMLDKNIDYSWSVTGLSANSGLSLEEDADSWRYSLRGTPAMADIGTHQITITVVDANDSSKSTSISFELTVVSDQPDIGFNENYVDPCSLPLRIVVEGFGGNVDPQVLHEGKFRAKIGSNANIRLKAVRGGLLLHSGTSKGFAEPSTPVGTVKWSVKSKVRNSHHCRPRPVKLHEDNRPTYHDDNMNFDSSDLKNEHGSKPRHKDEYRYVYSWTSPDPDSCEGRYGAESDSEWRVTRNPTWQAMGSLSLVGANKTQAEGNVLNLSGKILYDGPLPVKDLPLDRDAVELIEVTATDGCSAGGDLNLIATKTLEIGIEYPVNGEGGRIEDVEVEMDYTDVGQFWSSGYHYDNPLIADSMEPGASPDMKVNCDDPEFQAICDSDAMFVMLFKGNGDFSNEAWEKFEKDWDVLDGIKESMGHVFYDFSVCNDSDDACEERMVDHLNLPGQSKSLRDVQQIYLWWVALPKCKGSTSGACDETQYPDFDIEEIELKTKYWYAKFEDENDDFDNNITKHYVRSSCLTNRERFPGMSPASRRTDRQGYRGVFRRRELAGYIPTP